ncbi:AAA domain-containing protein [Sulfurimonas aquatica]|uniref:AAA domain-containing protein n=1 Tax=Sulfurimonas aquatica TaxID=2672570 RepID=A0A975GCZ1_9BACT|nr:AAA family ATPase [Sulfurimonas aquatica]QSZ42201.1 AAA domain-containing protein [Sulfurimonas aquatica]
MTREEISWHIKVSKSKLNKLTFVKSGYVHSPFISQFAPVKKHEFNSSYYAMYSLVANPDVHFVTVLSYYDKKYILKCGDPYLAGMLTDETVENLVNQTLEKAESKNKKLPSILRASFKTTPRSSSCSFNQKNYEQSNDLCEHISNFLSDLPNEVLDNLYTKYTETLHGESTNGLSYDLQVKFDRYAFKKHILLEGDKGSGKTYAATSWGKDKKVTELFIGGHEQFESIDFLGHYIQKKSGDLAWKDGPLSEAFRKSKRGEKVLLIIDEILRIPKRELNILISALSPIDEKYVLRTGRALDSKNDIAMEEVIKTPVENLWVIGTTNIGANYAVEAMDEALIDRFKPIRKDTTQMELQKILMLKATKRNFPSEHVSKLMDFYSKMKRLETSKVISKIVNIRHLSEAIELAKNPKEIREIIIDSKLIWVERDYNGYPNVEQLSAVEAVIGQVYDC